MSPLSVVDLLASARAGLLRLDPRRAQRAWQAGAVLVDIRPAAQRAEEGEVPGAMLVERNVLEWRFDPASDARLPLASYDLHVIVLCSEGYTSSLAAAALQQVGCPAGHRRDRRLPGLAGGRAAHHGRRQHPAGPRAGARAGRLAATTATGSTSRSTPTSAGPWSRVARSS